MTNELWNSLQVHQIRWPAVSQHKNEYDLFVGTVGYETRASYACTQLESKLRAVVAGTYPVNRIHAFGKNLAYFQTVGEVVDGTTELVGHVAAFLANQISAVEDSPIRVCVDISSMSRDRLADVVRALLLEQFGPSDLIVDWVYTPARFSRRLLETGPVRYNDAIPGFEGWGDPAQPLFAIVGMGLEGSILYGVLDDVEPVQSWGFEPFGFDHRYDQRVSTNNESFISTLDSSRLIPYDVVEPYSTFLKLANLVSELSSEGRVIILPLGPKIFSLMALVVGCANRQNVTVWRLSADPTGKPIDRVPAGSDPLALRTRRRISEDPPR